MTGARASRTVWLLLLAGLPAAAEGQTAPEILDEVAQKVWNYLPRVDRTIKVPPSLMIGAWMDSHFTNDDLVKESRCRCSSESTR